MSDKWRGLHGPITADAAEREPEHVRLFGLSFEAKMCQHAARIVGAEGNTTSAVRGLNGKFAS